MVKIGADFQRGANKRWRPYSLSYPNYPRERDRPDVLVLMIYFQ